MNTTTDIFVLNLEVQQEIDRWVKKYPPDQKRSAVVTALLLAQQQNGGWLSEAAMDAVANYLEMPPIAVYEVASFYDMYNLAPIGKNKIGICTNVSCLLMGSDKIVACAQERLGIQVGETTTDGLFTLKELECMAACNGAPMCQINDREYHENLTKEKMLSLIDQLEKEAQHHAS